MSKQPANASLCCSFCGKTRREVLKLIAGPTVYICDQCILLCNEIITEIIANEPDSHEPDLRQMLLAAVESHEITFEKLVELSDRVGGRLPGTIKDAIVEVGSTLRRLRSSVAGSLPGAPASVERTMPDEVDVTDVWPEVSRLVATTSALVSVPEKVPRMVCAQQWLALRTIIRELTSLTDFLARERGPSGSAPPRPRD